MRGDFFSPTPLLLRASHLTERILPRPSSRAAKPSHIDEATIALLPISLTA